ncbi:alpha-galactosidase [Streptomyces sp. NPDC048330]|uniref:alpha-galactosidase n=1 Tax=Streptomyces sp. NPDC048330 TaxID=3365533 RepID=UPI0037105F08
MPLAHYDQATGLLVLTAKDSSYAVRLDPASGSFRLVHWGCALSFDEVLTAPFSVGPQDSFAGPWDGTEEFTTEAGPRYGPPGLAVRFADGDHLLSPVLEGCSTYLDGEGARAVIRMRDSVRPLAWELHYTVREQSPVIERHTLFEHTGDVNGGEVVLSHWASAQWNLPHLDSYRVSCLHGGWSREGQLQRLDIPVGEFTLTSRRGHTGHDAGPWMMLDDSRAGEEHGEVWTVQMAASSSWRMTALRTTNGRCSVTATAGHEGVERVLHPGETLRTPTSTGCWTAGGFGAASRAHHRWVRDHVLPHPKETRPVLYNSWEATGFEVTEENQRQLATRAAALGVELFVVDDGWFGTRDDDQSGLGEWTHHPGKFPRGLGPLADHVHELGMMFGLWVEPEMFNPNGPLSHVHPAWSAHSADRPPTFRRNQLVLDFSLPEVVDWATHTLSQVVHDHHVDFLKWDFNRSFTEANHSPGGIRSRPVNHATGFHQVLDRIRKRFPDLRVESCAGGGGRINAAVLRRTDQVWPSDNTDPSDRLVIQEGFSQVWPAQIMSSWVTDSPNSLTSRRTPLAFRFHVAMAGVLGIGADITQWSQEESDQAAELVGLYKQVRHLVQHGDLYRLRQAAMGRPGAIAFVRPDGLEAVVLVWDPHHAFGHEQAPLRVPGLQPNVQFTTDSPQQLYTGAYLAACGLPLSMPASEHASRLVWLRAQSAHHGASGRS